MFQAFVPANTEHRYPLFRLGNETKDYETCFLMLGTSGLLAPSSVHTLMKDNGTAFYQSIPWFYF